MKRNYTSGKYFRLSITKNLDDSEYVIYEWIRNNHFLVILEPNEISFGFYKDYDLRGNMLVIPLVLTARHEANLEVKVKSLYGDSLEKYLKTDEENIEFKDFFYEFIEDLYIYKYFNDSGKNENIKLALESVPIIKGIVFKKIFELKNLDIDSQEKLSLPIIDVEKAIFRRSANQNWIKFLINKKNEHVFNDYDEESHWFRKVDEEINDLMQKLENDDNYKSDFFSKANLASYFLKSYDLTSVFKYFTPRNYFLFNRGLNILLFFLILAGTAKPEWFFLDDFFWKKTVFSSTIILFLSSPVIYFIFFNCVPRLYNKLCYLYFRKKSKEFDFQEKELKKQLEREAGKLYEQVREIEELEEKINEEKELKKQLEREAGKLDKQERKIEALIEEERKIEALGEKVNEEKGQYKIRSVDSRTNHSAVFPSLFIPRLAIAIVSGWLVFLTAEELLKIDLTIGSTETWISFAIVMAVLVVFLMSEVKDISRRKIPYMKIIFIVVVGFNVSYCSGFFIMSHISKKFLMTDSFLQTKNKLKENIYVNISKVDADILHLESIKFKFSLNKDNFNNLNYRYNKKNQKDYLIFNPIKDKQGRYGYDGRIDHQEIPLGENVKLFKKFINEVESNVKNKRDVLRGIAELISLKDSTIITKKIKAEKVDEISKTEKSFFVTLNHYMEVISSSFEEENLNKILASSDNNKMIDALNEITVDCFDKLNLSIECLNKIKSSEQSKLREDWNKISMENVTEAVDSSIDHYHFNFPFWSNGGHENDNTSSSYTLEFFPYIIFIRSLIALFVGVFIQLVLQDKSITEPI